MNPLNKWAYRDLSYMFSDKEFVISLLETDEKCIANRITVNNDGSVTLGKTRYRWINRLFGAEKTLSPETVCLRLIQIVTGHGGGRNDQVYTDLCKRFSEYYKDGNYSLAISAIFVAYRFVLAPDIKTMVEKSSVDEKRKIISTNNNVTNAEVLLNGVMVRDGSGQAVVVDISNPRQVLFRRP